MSSTMQDLIFSQLYGGEQAPELEKTAEQAMLEGLRETGQTDENPFENMSNEELFKLAQAAEAEIKEGEEHGEESEDIEKVAFDMLGGQVMAHACVHEYELIKQAAAEGLCRVCKTNPLDLEGSSICSECMGAE